MLTLRGKEKMLFSDPCRKSCCDAAEAGQLVPEESTRPAVESHIKDPHMNAPGI